MSENSFSVSELNRYIRDVVQAGFPQTIWLCGEIQGYDRNKDKPHVFFELVEKDPKSHDVLARIGLVIFSGRKAFIQEILAKSENAFSLKDDIEVKVACKVDFYPPHGAMRLIVESIDPVYTLGKIAQERQKLIAALKQKGILDKNKRLSLPLVPLRIGLVSAFDSAAYNDFLSELEKSRYHFKIYFRNTLMQGRKTEGDVCDALQELKKIKDLDVVIITRGGGSIADLSCFDSQAIAEAIAAYPLPVLSGIGHEINTTITDMAAHTYAKTPTAIAQYILSCTDKFIERLDAHLTTIMELAQDRIDQDKGLLKNWAGALEVVTRRYFEDHHKRLILAAEVLKKRPGFIVKELRRNLDDRKTDLSRVVRHRLHQDHLRLSSIEKVIGFAHPMNTIKRGFSVTRTKDGKILRKVSQISAAETVTTEVFDGVIESQVQAVSKRKD